MDFGTSAFLVVSGLGDDFSVEVLDGVGFALAGYSPGLWFGSSHPTPSLLPSKLWGSFGATGKFTAG
jgi:hypothetical protein